MIAYIIAAIALGMTQARPQVPISSVTGGSAVCPPQGHWLLPHEYDCTKFYYCEYGVQWETPRDCALGTEFSFELQICVHPQLANCQLSGVPPTEAPETQAPETEPTSTQAPETEPTTTLAPETEAPTTTLAPETEPTTTLAPETEAPTTTLAPETEPPTTLAPETEAPTTTQVPETEPTTTLAPETEAPTTTQVPETEPTTTLAPETEAPTTTLAPETEPTTTLAPETEAPTTTLAPETEPPTTLSPETEAPTTTQVPETEPTTTLAPETEAPTTTQVPETEPTTTLAPVTEAPTTTLAPETEAPTTTQVPETEPTTTLAPEMEPPTTLAPETEAPTTTQVPETEPTTTLAPETEAPTTTLAPETEPPTTLAPETEAPTTLAPETEAPTTTQAPETNPTTTKAPETEPTTTQTAETEPTQAPETEAPTTTQASETEAPSEAPTTESEANECPADWDIHVLLAHETECDLYYSCVHGEKVLMPCAPGTHFNPAIQVCDWPENAGCANSGNGTEDNGNGNENSNEDNGTEEEDNENELLDNGCPADWNVHQLLPHETECDRYYSCVHGDKVLMPCSPGTHFNPLLQVCDWPENAGCANSGNSVEDNGSEDNGNGSVEEDSDNGSGSGESLDNGCPADWNVHKLLPHETECDLYYSCVHGDKVLMPCSPGTHFNPVLQVCDWPENAGCINSGNSVEDSEEASTTQSPETEATITQAPETEAPATKAPTTTEEPTTEDSEVNECPADWDIHLLLPHETECNLYYSCVHGEKVLMPCAPGTHFNPAIQVCDWPENAGCANSGNSAEDNGNGNENSEEDNGTEEEDNENEWLDNGCPADWNVHQLLPHESECDRYYSCVHGDKVLMPCSPGTHFNPVLQVCDWPENAGCTNSGNSVEDSSTTQTPETETQTTQTPESEAPTTQATETEATTTQATATETPTTQATETEATTTQATETETPTTKATETEAPATEAPTTTEKPTTDSEVNECPADWNIHLLLPHETECDLYYSCVHGDKVVMPCSPGTHFNPVLQVCDWPENAGCSNAGNSVEDSGNGEDNGSGNGSVEEDNGSGSGETLDNGCPADWNVHQLLPHESECDRYYSCVHGDKVLMSCAPGTHFNPALQACDWPENAGCANSGNSAEDNGSGEEDNSNGSGEEDNGSGEEDNGSGEEDNGSGEEDNGNGNSGEWLENGCPADFNVHQLLPHESECGKYYQCVHGETIEMPCSPGTHFNPTLQACDWPENAGCANSGSNEEGSGSGEDNNESGNVEEGGSGNASTEVDNGSEESSGNGSGEEDTGNGGGDNDSKCIGTCNVVPWAHETDCDKFWRCDGEKAALVVCSEGLHFNANSQTCDFICNANCVRENAQTTIQNDGVRIFLPWEDMDTDLLQRYVRSHKTEQHK